MNDPIETGVWMGATIFALGKLYDLAKWTRKRVLWAKANKANSGKYATFFNPMGLDGYSWKRWYLE